MLLSIQTREQPIMRWCIMPAAHRANFKSACHALMRKMTLAVEPLKWYADKLFLAARPMLPLSLFQPAMMMLLRLACGMHSPAQEILSLFPLAAEIQIMIQE